MGEIQSRNFITFPVTDIHRSIVRKSEDHCVFLVGDMHVSFFSVTYMCVYIYSNIVLAALL